MNVPYKLGEGGSTILVPSNVVGDYQDEAGDAGPSKAGASEPITSTSRIRHDGPPGTGQPAARPQGKLVKSTSRSTRSRPRRVHLAIPRQTIFLREHQKPTAYRAFAMLCSPPGRSAICVLSDSRPERPHGDGSGLLSRPSGLFAAFDPGKPSRLPCNCSFEVPSAHRITSMIETIVGRATSARGHGRPRLQPGRADGRDVRGRGPQNVSAVCSTWLSRGRP